MGYYTPAKKCKLDSAWIGPYLIVSLIGWALGIQKDSESPIVIQNTEYRIYFQFRIYIYDTIQHNDRIYNR